MQPRILCAVPIACSIFWEIKRMQTATTRRGADHAAHLLLMQMGQASLAEAADRAEERFANIDVGGFAFWKSVEHVIGRSLAMGG